MQLKNDTEYLRVAVLKHLKTIISSGICKSRRRSSVACLRLPRFALWEPLGPSDTLCVVSLNVLRAELLGQNGGAPKSM